MVAGADRNIARQEMTDTCVDDWCWFSSLLGGALSVAVGWLLPPPADCQQLLP